MNRVQVRERLPKGAVTTVILVLSSILLGWYLVPSWLLLSCGTYSVVAGTVLLASRQWPSAFDRAFAHRTRVPLWLWGAGTVVVVLWGTLLSADVLTAETGAWAGIVGVSVAVILGTLFRQRPVLSTSGWVVPTWLCVTCIGIAGSIAWVVGWTGSALAPVFFTSFATFFFFVWFIVPLAVYQRSTDHDPPESGDSLPMVSVLVPAYNEEGYVGRCIDRILDADYPAGKCEILVVDDGSTDGTFEEAAQRAGPRVTVHSKPNGGKHSALNYGIEHTSGDIVVVVDADSFIEASALTKVVRKFRTSSTIGAVASDVRVVNRRNGVSRLQTLEYILGINTFRRAFDFFGAIPVVPGCLGAFRREALLEAGGYDGDTLTEDFDVTIKLLRSGWTVRHTAATVWTEAPYSWRDLYQQRLRWNRGNVEVILKHNAVFLSDETKYLHRLVFPLRFGTMLLAPIVAVAVLTAVAISLLNGGAAAIAGMVAYFMVVGTLLGLLVIRLEGESLRLVPYAIPLIVAYPLFQAVVIAMSLAYVARNADRDWASVHRLAQDATTERT